jgi:hypothetical protein
MICAPVLVAQVRQEALPTARDAVQTQQRRRVVIESVREVSA